MGELWWSHDVWHHSYLGSTVDFAIAVSGPTGYAFEAQGTQHAIYVGDDGHVHERWWDSDDVHDTDLTTKAAATAFPPQTKVPSAYVYLPSGTQHVYYQGIDQHIHEIWWGLDYEHVDLTVEADSPPAIGSPASYVFNAQRTKHVVYQGIDQHIHELWRFSPGRWHHNDLTLRTEAPLAAGDPTGYVFDAQGTQHVVYRGSDRHIHELWWDSNGWHPYNDLTRATGAPLPLKLSNPSGYAFAARGTQHVVYVAQSEVHSVIGRVIELLWVP